MINWKEKKKEKEGEKGIEIGSQSSTVNKRKKLDPVSIFLFTKKVDPGIMATILFYTSFSFHFLLFFSFSFFFFFLFSLLIHTKKT